MRVIATRLCLLAVIPFALAPAERWPPKLGVKTPGVQIPMPALKAETEIAFPAPVDSLLLTDAAYIASKAKNQVTPWNAKTSKTEDPIAGVPQPCATMLSAFGSVWVPSCKDQTVSRMDPKSKKITATIPLHVLELRDSLAANADSVWALSDEKTTLVRIDPEENKIVAEIRLPAACNSMLFAENSLWVTCPKEDRVLRIDPNTNLVTNRIEVAGQPTALTFGEATIWALSKTEGKVVRIDPKTNKTTTTIELKVPAVGGDLVFSDGFVWVSMPGFPVARIDPAIDKVMQQFAGEGGGAIYAGLGSLWLPNLKPNTLSRFDPKRIKATLAE